MSKNVLFIILVGLFIFIAPFSAQSEGIPLQKDVLLEAPIFGPEDLPEEVTFSLYNSPTALSPIGLQTFQRGQYTVDFEFSKSDGITSGNVARIGANFTNKLALDSDSATGDRTKEIWLGIEAGGAQIGDRTKVSDETLVQLLLSSDASIATYLTLVYEGEDNPLTTIYKGLPISTLSPGSSASSLSSYFSSLPSVSASADGADRGSWQSGAGDNVYVNGSVGIWTATPGQALDVQGFISVNDSIMNPGDTQKVTIYSSKTPNKGAKLEFWAAGNSTYPGHIYLDYGDYTAAINSACKFNVRAMSNGGVTNVIIANAAGNVGIGTTPGDTYKLAVCGSIRAKEIVVDTGWCDFVFADDYALPSLSQVEQFISENKHLPGIPSEAEVKENGVTLGSISSKLLQKIEELTLYVIELKKENEVMKSELGKIQKGFGAGSIQ